MSCARPSHNRCTLRRPLLGHPFPPRLRHRWLRPRDPRCLRHRALRRRLLASRRRRAWRRSSPSPTPRRLRYPPHGLRSRHRPALLRPLRARHCLRPLPTRRRVHSLRRPRRSLRFVPSERLRACRRFEPSPRPLRSFPVAAKNRSSSSLRDPSFRGRAFDLPHLRLRPPSRVAPSSRRRPPSRLPHRRCCRPRPSARRLR